MQVFGHAWCENLFAEYAHETFFLCHNLWDLLYYHRRLSSGVLPELCQGLLLCLEANPFTSLIHPGRLSTAPNFING